MFVSPIVLAAVAVYFVALFLIGLRATRSASSSDFAIGSRQVGVVSTLGSLSASFRDGGGIILWIGLAYSLGYGGLWLIAGATLAFPIVAWLGNRVRADAATHNYINISDLIAHRIGPSTARTVSVVVALACMLYTSIQIFVVGNLFETLLGVSAVGGAVLTSAVVGFYLIAGGYSSVVKTDVLQALLILALLTIPFFLPPAMHDVTNLAPLTTMRGWDIYGFFAIGFLYVLSSPDGWQRIFSAKSRRVVNIAFPLAGPVLLLMTLALLWIGFAAKPILGDVKPDRVLFSLVLSPEVGVYVKTVLVVAVMAITMSTLDTFSYVFGSTVVQTFLPKKALQVETYTSATRIAMGSMLLVATAVALTIQDAISFLIDSVSLIYVFAPLLAYCAIAKPLASAKLDRRCTLAIGVSTVLYITMFVTNAFASFAFNSIPALVCMVLVSIAVAKRDAPQPLVPEPSRP